MWTDTDNAVLAVVDAMRSICGALAVADQRTADRLAIAFEQQGQTYLQKHNPDGVLLMSMLLDQLGKQDAVQKLARVKPQGRA